MIRLLSNGLVRNQYSESDLFVAFYRCDPAEMLRAASHPLTGTMSNVFLTETASTQTQATCYSHEKFTSGEHTP
ncbi:hypothetical protein C474_13574 [Halogeometricum pallidum JCM 14848]|uniref:Uncharacterized protein n=1 Tax=Halogeometricum pallidum JCM 14848 TaxID=1227487 RepID=M0D4M1_HALPD|nr:hypothetical protein C474_13574 [Halogeometricum pallidum JCM 14848]